MAWAHAGTFHLYEKFVRQQHVETLRVIIAVVIAAACAM